MPHRLAAVKAYWMGGGIGSSVGVLSFAIPDAITQALILLATTLIGLGGAYLFGKANKIKAQGANAVAIIEAQGRAQAVVEAEKIAAQWAVDKQRIEAEGRLIETQSKANAIAIEAKAKADANHDSIEGVKAQLADALKQLDDVKKIDQERRHAIKDDLGGRITALEVGHEEVRSVVEVIGNNQDQIKKVVDAPDMRPIPLVPPLLSTILSGDELPRYTGPTPETKP